MSVSNYEVTLDILYIYALSSIPTESERIRHFAKELARYLQKATTPLVLASVTF